MLPSGKEVLCIRRGSKPLSGLRSYLSGKEQAVVFHRRPDEGSPERNIARAAYQDGGWRVKEKRGCSVNLRIVEIEDGFARRQVYNSPLLWRVQVVGLGGGAIYFIPFTKGRNKTIQLSSFLSCDQSPISRHDFTRRPVMLPLGPRLLTKVPERNWSFSLSSRLSSCTIPPGNSHLM